MPWLPLGTESLQHLGKPLMFIDLKSKILVIKLDTTLLSGPEETISERDGSNQYVRCNDRQNDQRISLPARRPNGFVTEVG